MIVSRYPITMRWYTFAVVTLAGRPGTVTRSGTSAYSARSKIKHNLLRVCSRTPRRVSASSIHTFHEVESTNDSAQAFIDALRVTYLKPGELS